MAHSIYADELTSLKHGYPLWDPDCSPEVRIADVGYIRDGQFCRLFNASLPKGDPANRSFGEPDGYVPLRLRDDDIRDRTPLPPGVICSRSVSKRGVDTGFSGSILEAGAGFNFECKKKRGAILIINSDAYRKDALRLGAFKEYIIQHHDSWLRLANNAHNARDISLHDLVFVTGCDNTADWATAAFMERSISGGVSFEAGYPTIAGAHFSIWGSWSQLSSLQSHCGPRIPRFSRSSTDSESTEAMSRPVCAADLHKYNQCIFLRGFRVLTRRERARRKVSLMTPADSGGIEGVPKPWRTSSSSSSLNNSRSNSEHETDSLGRKSSQRSNTDTQDDLEASDIDILSNHAHGHAPIEALLEYILQKSDTAQIAVAHDNDMAEIIKDEDEEFDWNTLIKDAAVSVHVDSDGVGTITKRDVSSASELQAPPVKDGSSRAVTPLQTETAYSQHLPRGSGSSTPSVDPARTPRAPSLELYKEKQLWKQATIAPESFEQQRPAQAGPSSIHGHKAGRHKATGSPDGAPDTELGRIRAEINVVKARLSVVQDMISLTTKTGRVADRRSALRAELAQTTIQSANTLESKTMQDEVHKKIKEHQNLTKKLSARTTEDVDSQIRTLERRVETGTMSVPEEKAALRQISGLRRSRVVVERAQVLQAEIDALRRGAEGLRKQGSTNATRANSVRNELEVLDRESEAAFAERDTLYDERTQLRMRLSELYEHLRPAEERLKAEARERRHSADEARAQAAEEARAMRAAQEQRRRAQGQEQLLERARAPAFANEIRECRSLLEYFSGADKKDHSASSSSSVSPTTETKHQPRQPMENHPDAWAGWVPLKKKTEEDSYFVGGKGKAKKGRRKDSSSMETGSVKLSIPLEILSTLLSLSIPPPSVTADVPQTVQDLRSKIEWFEANQPRVTEENVARTRAELQFVAKPMLYL